MSKQRRPKAAAEPPAPSKKLQLTGHLPPQSNRPLWSFAVIDASGDWCFGRIDGPRLLSLLTRLRDFETMTWTAIEQADSHFVPLSRLTSKATRLREINQDDIDELFSLRIQGRERVWGIRDGHVLRILWWDPNHEICPSHKR